MAYDMRISDCSSDLCSSALVLPARCRRLSVRADGIVGGVRDGHVVHPVAHACADHGDVPAQAAYRRRPSRSPGDAALAQSAGAVPTGARAGVRAAEDAVSGAAGDDAGTAPDIRASRSEEPTSELQSLMRL